MTRIRARVDRGKDGGIWDMRTDRDPPRANKLASLESIGDFLPALVKSAHSRGLEVYSLIKPFDMAYAYVETFPEGSKDARRLGEVEVLGGKLHASVAFLKKNPSMRIERNMAGIDGGACDQPVRTIRFIKHDDQPTWIKKAHLQIWISDDNTNYRRYEEPFEFRDDVEEMFEPIYGTQGNSRGGNRTSCRVLCLDGLETGAKYFAVTIAPRAEDGSFKNWLFALTEIVSDEGKNVPFTYGFHVRGDRCGVGEDFRRTGFLFDLEATGQAVSLGPAKSYLRSAGFLDNGSSAESVGGLLRKKARIPRSYRGSRSQGRRSFSLQDISAAMAEI